MKYDYRIVGRVNLSELEQAVRQLQRERWEMQRPDNPMTLEDALDACLPADLGGRPTGTLISVSMRREKRDED